jgi:hypothetical protein
MLDDQREQWWLQKWNERGRVVRAQLGETTPPGMVHTFRWDEPTEIVPGGCALTFAPTLQRSTHLIVTLGLTQPLDETNAVNPWEFSLEIRNVEPWCYHLLRDLVEGWKLHGNLEVGQFLPVSFFMDARGQLDCVADELPPQYARANSIRGLYLWPNRVERHLFEVSTGNFFLMAVTLVHRDEEALADDTTPPHLLLLLRRCGVGQISDPHRVSVRSHPHFEKLWREISGLSHERAFHELNSG